MLLENCSWFMALAVIWLQDTLKVYLFAGLGSTASDEWLFARNGMLCLSELRII